MTIFLAKNFLSQRPNLHNSSTQSADTVSPSPPMPSLHFAFSTESWSNFLYRKVAHSDASRVPSVRASRISEVPGVKRAPGTVHHAPASL